jgi:hypothetical protein
MIFPLIAGDAGREAFFANMASATSNWSTAEAWMAGCSLWSTDRTERHPASLSPAVRAGIEPYRRCHVRAPTHQGGDAHATPGSHPAQPVDRHRGRRGCRRRTGTATSVAQAGSTRPSQMPDPRARWTVLRPVHPGPSTTRAGAGTRWLNRPVTTRGLPNGGSDAYMAGGTLAQWFDIIVHRQQVTAVLEV